MKKNVKFFLMMLLGVAAIILGAEPSQMMAMAAANPTTGGGTATDINPGVTVAGNEGGATATEGHRQTEEQDNPDFYAKAIDQRITKMRPMRTPIDQITRSASDISHVKSMIVKYYSVNTRPSKATVSGSGTEEMGSGATQIKVPVTDSSVFEVTDTILCKGVKGYKEDGSTADTKWLMLYVVGKDTDGSPLCVAINGKKNSNQKNNIVPALTKNTVLIRMGRAAGELDVETGNFYNLPEPTEQFCQRFMMQVEQSTYDKMWDKEVDWNFDDIEEDGLYDMRLGMERSYLFGVKGKTSDPNKKTDVYTTGGIYWMAGGDVQLGHMESSKLVITDNDFVDFCKTVFTGNDAGNKVKLLFCGSDFLAAMAKMKSQDGKFIKNVTEWEQWGLKFSQFDSNFGKVMAMHHELFDDMDMADQAFLLDPEYLTKKHFEVFSRKTVNLEEQGKRRSTAVVMNEASCCYLRYPKAHWRVSLATA